MRCGWCNDTGYILATPIRYSEHGWSSVPTTFSCGSCPIGKIKDKGIFPTWEEPRDSKKYIADYQRKIGESVSVRTVSKPDVPEQADTGTDLPEGV